MVETFDFWTDWIDVVHGDKITLYIPASYQILYVGGIFKGVNTVGTGWEEATNQQVSNSDEGWGSASINAPAFNKDLAKYAWFEGGYIRHTATNQSGHIATMYMNNVNMGTVANGGGKLVDYEMQSNVMGQPLSTVAYLVPSGDVWCTILATLVYGYRMPKVQTFYTTNPGFIIGGNLNYKAQYIGVLGSGQESPAVLHNRPELLIPGQENEFTVGVYGSQKAKLKIGIRYANARPTPLYELVGTGYNEDRLAVSLCAVDDPGLEYGDILRFIVFDGADPVGVAADLVALDDAEASNFRVITDKGILSWRRLLTAPPGSGGVDPPS